MVAKVKAKPEAEWWLDKRRTRAQEDAHPQIGGDTEYPSVEWLLQHRVAPPANRGRRRGQRKCGSHTGE